LNGRRKCLAERGREMESREMTNDESEEIDERLGFRSACLDRPIVSELTKIGVASAPREPVGPMARRDLARLRNDKSASSSRTGVDVFAIGRDAQEPLDTARNTARTTSSDWSGGVTCADFSKAQEPTCATRNTGGTTRSAAFGGVTCACFSKAQEPTCATRNTGGTTRPAAFGGVTCADFSKAQKPTCAARNTGGTTRPAAFGGVTCACFSRDIRRFGILALRLPFPAGIATRVRTTAGH
jgi:hypothetical protein